jgi:MFS family permease
MAVLALCGTATSLQQTIVLPLLPELPRLLDTSTENASWVVTVTLLMGGVATPVVSRLADMHGKRTLMVACLVVMVSGSFLGSVSESLPVVLAARALQGVGMSLVPVGIAAMRDDLPGHRLPMGVALMSASMAIGAASAPPLAGVVVSYLGWHAVFWVSAALGATMLGLVLLVVPGSGPRTGGRFDYRGAILLSAGLAAVLLTISKGGAWGWTEPVTIATATTGVLLIGIWVPTQLRIRDPLVDVRAAARPAVLLVNVAAVLLGFGMFTNPLLTTQLMQVPTASGYGVGLDLLHTGLWLAPAALVFGGMAPVAAIISRRFDARVTLLVGALTMTLAYVGRVFFSHALWQIVLGACLVGVGTALTFAAMPTLIMSAVPVTQTASANGLNTLLRSVGTSTASAASAAVLALGLHSVAGTLVPTYSSIAAVFWTAAAASSVAALLSIPLFRITRRNPTSGPELVVLTTLAGDTATAISRATGTPSTDRQELHRRCTRHPSSREGGFRGIDEVL